MKKTHVIPPDTRYVPLTQQRWCCVPTCIQMIMLKYNIPLVSTEILADYLHVTVPPNEKHLFWNIRSSKKPPHGMYGTQVDEDSIANDMFTELGIPLRMKYTRIGMFETLDTFERHVIECVKKKKDVILCFNYRSLFRRGNDGGHNCVLDTVSTKDRTVRIIDPAARTPKWRIVKIKSLYAAMRKHGDENTAGFWELIKTR